MRATKTHSGHCQQDVGGTREHYNKWTSNDSVLRCNVTSIY